MTRFKGRLDVLRLARLAVGFGTPADGMELLDSARSVIARRGTRFTDDRWFSIKQELFKQACIDLKAEGPGK